MTKPCEPTLSPRHGFPFKKLPTVRGGMYGGSVCLTDCNDYAATLDTVYEMADDIMTGNGVSARAAVQKVLSDEGWKLLPTHIDMIVKKLEE